MIELVKTANASINFGLLILISFLFQSDELFLYVTINSISFLFALIFDRGLSNVNSYTGLTNGIFFSSKSGLHSSRTLQFIIFLFVLGAGFIYLYGFSGNIFLLSLLLSFPSLIFLRYRLVNVRDGNYISAAVHSELIPSLIKLILVPLIFLNIKVYFVALISIYCLYTYFLNKKSPISNIFTFFKSEYFTYEGSKPYINFLYALSAGTKSFGINSILTTIEPAVAASLFIVSRISQTGVIIMSGIYSRIPSGLKLTNEITSRNKILKIATLNFIFFLFLIVFSDELFNLMNLLFFSIGEFIPLSKFLYILIIFPVLINFYTQLFLALGKTSISLGLDLIYILILISSLLYYGYI